MKSFAVLALATAATVSALPNSDVAAAKRSIIKRQSLTAPGTGDAVILNFALTLEHLEATFYAQALANFTAADFSKAGYSDVYTQLQGVARDEADHVTFLTTALSAAGATPVEACTYKFPYTDVVSFLGLSQVLEGVGVSAYLGAAGAINNTAYLTAAASILTVEARHAAFVRYINGYQPAPQPNDTPESATAVVTMATPFFVSCPAGSAPTIKPFPALKLNTTAPKIGSMIQIAPTNASAVGLNGTIYCGFASGLGAAFSPYTNGSCMIPTANITAGQTYVVLTTGPSVSDASVLAGPAILELDSKGNSTNSTTSGSSTGSAGSASGSASGASASGSTAKSAASTLSFSAVALFVAAAFVSAA